MEHAFHYSWPSACLQDNLYYSPMLQLEVDPVHIIEDNRKKDEVLVNPEGIVIRKVFFFYNRHIGKGYPKNWAWEPNVELLPANQATPIAAQFLVA